MYICICICIYIVCIYNEEKGVYDKVRDHCHITGNYRGAAHNSCNLQLRFGNVIPVVFHDLRGYDSHLIMQAISKVDGEIACIPNNMEKYIAFSLIKKKKLEKVKKKVRAAHSGNLGTFLPHFLAGVSRVRVYACLRKAYRLTSHGQGA